MDSDTELGLSTSWIGMRLGIDPVRVNAMRRAGELYAVRRSGSQEYRFPAWQFGPDLKLRPSVERVLAAAREAGIDEPTLEALLNRRVGVVGVVGARRRLLDVLVEGDEGPVLEEIRRAPRA